MAWKFHSLDLLLIRLFPFVMTIMTFQHFFRNVLGFSNPPWDRLWLFFPVILWIVTLRSWRRLSEAVVNRWLFLFLAYIGLHTIFIANSENVIAGIVGAAGWVMWVSLFFWLSLGRTQGTYDAISYSMIYAALLNSIPLFYEHLTAIQIQPAGSTIPLTNIYRYEGLGINNGISSTQLMVGGLVCSYYLTQNSLRSTRIKLLLYLGLGLIFSALLLSTIRGSIILFWLGIAILLIFSRTPVRQKMSVLCFVAAVSFLTITVFFAGVEREYLIFLGNSLTLDDPGNIERLGVVAELSAIVAEHSGTGLASFGQTLFGSGAGVFSYGAEYALHKPISLESSFVRIKVELGILGLIFFLTLIFMVIRNILRASLAKDHKALFSLIILAVISLRAMQNDILQTWIGGFYFWGLLGLAVGSVTQTEVRKTSPIYR